MTVTLAGISGGDAYEEKTLHPCIQELKLIK